MADEPSMWDLQRLIERNHADNREDILDLKAQLSTTSAQNAAQFERYLLREVYDAKESARDVEHRGFDQRIRSLEEDVKTARNRAVTAIYAAVGSVISAILVGIVMFVILGGTP